MSHRTVWPLIWVTSVRVVGVKSLYKETWSQESTLVGLLVFSHSTLLLDCQKICVWPPAKKVPGLARGLWPRRSSRDASSPFLPTQIPTPPLLRLTYHEDYTPLTFEEISRALSELSNTSAPGPDHIPYAVWKSVHRLKPSLLPSLLDPLLAHGFPPLSLKKTLDIILDKPGKSWYDSPSSFRVIVLLRTLSKILERVVVSCLSA